MSVTVRPYRRGGWEVDIVWRSPDGRRRRDRKHVGGASKAAARRWGTARERELLVRGPTGKPKEVPTFNAFWPRFLDGYALANRQKPSGVAAKETIGRVHLQPHFGSKRLDAVTTEQVQRLKHSLSKRAPKTVNNILTVLNVLLKKAVEWHVLDRMPCTVRLLPIPKPSAGFYDFDDYESLVAAAKTTDPRAHLVMLLGGDAGLRCGEIMALEWSDVNLRKRQLCVQRSDWKGHVTTTKGGRLRYVPMTTRLAAALQSHRHLRSERVLCQNNGQPLTQKIVRDHVLRAARRAQVPHAGVHRLRHTFCSHLAMRGAPARAIQELAGHVDLSTTQRYMHLSPAAIESAIRLLESPGVVPRCGDIVETGVGE